MHYVKTFYAKLRGASRKIPRASQLGHSDNSEKADWGCDQRKIVETEGGPANASHYSRKSICQRRSVWVGSQVVNRAQGTAAKVAGLPLEQVQGSAIGGRFQAVRIAKQVDGPVKVVWTREVDIRHDNDPPDWMRKACRSPDVTGSPVPRSKRDGAVSFGLKSRA